MRRSRASSDLHGKTAVVTGAGSGIGRAIADLLEQRGTRVHRADIAGDAPGVTHAVDVSDAAAVQALADSVGPVDLLFNNAGIGHAGPVAQTPLEDWRRVVEVNLMGVIHGVHAFLPGMLERGSGHIVNTASMAGLVPQPGLVPYATAKFGVVGLSESLDLEVRHLGVRVHALCPGIIHTDIVRTSTLRGEVASRRERIDRLYKARGASPEVVAQAALSAVARGRVIVPTPRHHVLPAWYLQRFAPPVGRVITRGIARVTGVLR